MKTRRTLQYYRPGDVSGLEKTLNRMSQEGWQILKPGRFLQHYGQGEGSFVHRFDFCQDRPGSAGEITFLAARERAGWTPIASRGGWRLYRKRADAAEEAEELPEGRARIRALFARRTARLETVRRWMLVLGTLLLIIGYAADLLPVLYATALPMAVALFVTCRIKFMEEDLRK